MADLKIVAELSANHLGSKSRALDIVAAAYYAGATHFKVQVWEQGTMCLDQNYEVPSGPWAGRKLQHLYAEAYTPWEWLPDIFAECRALGMEPFGSAFDRESVDYLESLGVKRHKVASFELTDLPLIRYMASKGKPIILSTGMAIGDDIEQAFWAAQDSWMYQAHPRPHVLHSQNDVTILRCASAYPADPAGTLQNTKGVFLGPWGLSDHTEGIGVSVAAVALGATMLEKHLTLSRADGGLDAGFSLEPDEFKQLVIECKRAHAAIQPAKPQKEHTELRRSLWWAKDIQEGETITQAHLVTARPALGAHPRYMDSLIDTKATQSAKANTPVTCSPQQ